MLRYPRTLEPDGPKPDTSRMFIGGPAPADGYDDYLPVPEPQSELPESTHPTNTLPSSAMEQPHVSPHPRYYGEPAVAKLVDNNSGTNPNN